MRHHVKDVGKQLNWCNNKFEFDNSIACKYHLNLNSNSLCVLNKREKIVAQLNYFVENLMEIHQNIPFEFQETMGTTNTSSFASENNEIDE